MANFVLLPPPGSGNPAALGSQVLADTGPPGFYRPRRPERTVLYQVVQIHLETFLSRLREADPDADPVPRHVERTFRRYLECGIFALGFARAHCSACGHDSFVAHSCKTRGLCPSCNTRRMAETAAHLVDHVIPFVPVRQWVLSLPKRLRYFLAHDPKVTGGVLRIFLRSVEGALRKAAASVGVAGTDRDGNGIAGADGGGSGIAGNARSETGTVVPRGVGSGKEARCGAVGFLHRFGSAINAHYLCGAPHKEFYVECGVM